MDLLKRLVFKLYCVYHEKSPLQRGKARLGIVLLKLFGLARYPINGLQLELNPVSDIDRSLIVRGRHNGSLGPRLQELMAQGGVFIDIGANIGYFSMLVARIPGTQVFSFEPSPREQQRFARGIALNGLNNITLFPYGISDREELALLNLYSLANPGMNSRLKAHGEMVDQKECFFAPLGHFLSEKLLSQAKVVKVDVEGFELHVVKGFAPVMRLLEQAVFIVEVSEANLSKAGHSAAELYAFFASFGFEPRLGLSGKALYDEEFRRPRGG